MVIPTGKGDVDEPGPLIGGNQVARHQEGVPVAPAAIGLALGVGVLEGGVHRRAGHHDAGRLAQVGQVLHRSTPGRGRATLAVDRP